ncbi:hypothetical protein V7S76_10845 [Aquirufa sp. ROCK2-A2]
MKETNKITWKDVDADWKEKLHQRAEEPNQAVWEQLNAKLAANGQKTTNQNKTKNRLYWPWAAIFVFALGIWWAVPSGWSFKEKEVIANVKNVEKLEARKEGREVRKENREERKEEREERKEKREERKEEREVGKERLEGQTITVVEGRQNLKSRYRKMKTTLQQHVVEKQTKQDVVALIENTSEQKAGEKVEKPETSNEVWVKIDINPLQKEQIKEQELVQNASIQPLKKKKSFGQLVRQVRNLLKGESVEGNNANSLDEGIHQVANTYYRTEEKIKQTFQIQ